MTQEEARASASIKVCCERQSQRCSLSLVTSWDEQLTDSAFDNMGNDPEKVRHFVESWEIRDYH